MFTQEYLLSLASDWTVILFTTTIVCLYIGYRYINRNYDYFSKRNVPFPKPTFFFGNTFDGLWQRKSSQEQLCDLYKKLNEHRIGGIFQFLSPMYFVRDPELIKYMTVKDFEHFVDINTFIPDDVEPLLSKSLQALTGQKWKNMRSTLSPAFTSSKMKLIFVLVSETGQQLASYIEEEIKKRQDSTEQEKTTDPKDVLPMELKELFTKYTNDVIATSAFGIQVNTLKDPNNEFYSMGKQFMDFKLYRLVIFMGFIVFPKLMKLMGFSILDKRINKFFRTLVSDAIQIREKEGIVRPDMIHLLMQVRDENMFEDKSSETKNSDIQDAKKISLGIDDIAAQALVFFSAGFEVVSQLLTFCGMMLAVHQDIQQRLRDEIDEVLEQNGGQITYEAIHSMKYLDCVISETLRMYPPAPLTTRKCVKEYRVPGSDIIIEKDSKVSFPIVALHHDPKYFPEPEVFNPDRFNDDNKHNIQPFTYMPFGAGPRQCIANRFALMESKAALVHLLKRFEIHTVSKTKLPLQLAKGFKLTFEGDPWAGFKLRTDETK